MPDLPSFLGEIALRSSLVLAVTFGCLGAMRRAAASERHLVLSLALFMTVLFPAGLLLSPKFTWTIPLPKHVEDSAPLPGTAAPMLPANEPTASADSIPTVENKPSFTNLCTAANGLTALFAAGMFMQVSMLGRAVWSWRRIRQHAEEAHLPDTVLKPARFFTGARTIPPIFISDQISVPLLAGWLRPEIILPADAVKWPSQRLLMALCHELAHYRRGDSLLLPMICFLRVFYWWHPLVWLGLARLRRERETACDDLVLTQNFRATDYADLIVSAARWTQMSPWQAGALAMASSSNVSERIRAILNPALNRRQTGRATVLIGLILAFNLGWFFAAAQVQAEDRPATLNPKANTDPSKPQIKLEFRLISIDEKTYLSHQKEIDTAVANLDQASLVTLVNHLPGTALFTAVTTQDGLKANIDILREMPYVVRFDKDKDGNLIPSDFKTRVLGLSVVALPTLTADGKSVDLFFHLQISSFERFEDVSPGMKRPVFDEVSTTTKVLMGEHGYAAWVGGPGPTPTYLPEQDEVLAKSIIPKRILLLVTARPVPAEPQAAVIPSNAMVQVLLKYFQISEKTYAQQTSTVADALAMTDALNRGDVSYFSRLPDFDLLTEPSVLMKVGEQGVLKAVKKMSYPAKLVRDGTGKFIPSGAVTDRDVGMSFVMHPELLADGTISLNCFDEITSFKGWIETGSQEEQPVFNVSRVNGRYALVTGKPFGTWVRTDFDDQSKSMIWKAGDPPFPIPKNTPRVRIAMVITANLYAPDGSPMPTH